jgi:hypothetical protein
MGVSTRHTQLEGIEVDGETLPGDIYFQLDVALGLLLEIQV